MTYDLLFPARGDTLPADHAYPLYAALSRVSGRFHADGGGARFAAVTGDRAGPGQIRLTAWSRLRVRAAAETVLDILRLAGATLRVGEAVVRLGPPLVVPLVPAAAVQARVVTFKHGDELARFLATARAKLTEAGVAGEPIVPAVEAGPRAGEPRRRVVRVKGKAVIGYALVVSGLTADGSLRLQEAGLGGRTRIGCGFFLPVRIRG